jgi:hypothetical protein
MKTCALAICENAQTPASKNNFFMGVAGDDFRKVNSTTRANNHALPFITHAPPGQEKNIFISPATLTEKSPLLR